MEKRLLLAVAISFGLLFLWQAFVVPPTPPSPSRGETPVGATKPPSAAATPDRDHPATETAESGKPVAPSVDASGPTAGEPISAESVEERKLETEVYRIRLTNQGARVLSWQLKKYLDDHGEPLELVSPGAAKLQRFPLRLDFRDEGITEKIERALFVMEVGEGAGGAATRVTFRFADGQGLYVSKVLDLKASSYVSRLELEAFQDGKPLDGEVIWGPGFGSHADEVVDNGTGSDVTRAIVSRGGRITRHPRSAVKEKRRLREDGEVAWAGLEDRYFASLFVPSRGSSGATIRVESLIEEGREREFLSLGLDLARANRYDLFIGPKDYDLLARMKIGIEGIVDFGFFGSIAQALFFMLKYIHRSIGNWGWSIILLTFFIRLIFFPLTQKSSVSMRRTQEKMKKIQPKMTAIKERYRKMKKDYENRQKMNEEIMNLYRKEGVNPLSGMAGCLPLLLQLPILWGFYNLLNVAIELRHAPFALWIADLSKKDPYYVTPIVMGITMLIQQMMTSSTIPDPMQRRLMNLMPVMFTWFFKDLPSGLVLYWLVNNILAIGQQYLINAQAARENAREGALAKS